MKSKRIREAFTRILSEVRYKARNRKPDAFVRNPIKPPKPGTKVLIGKSGRGMKARVTPEGQLVHDSEDLMKDLPVLPKISKNTGKTSNEPDPLDP